MGVVDMKITSNKLDLNEVKKSFIKKNRLQNG